MLPNTELYYARTALTHESWESRYAALESLCSLAEPSDIPRIESCLTDPYAPVRTMALNALKNLLAFESETAIKQCLFYNDPKDHYGSLEVRESARLALDSILAHTRKEEATSVAANS